MGGSGVGDGSGGSSTVSSTSSTSGLWYPDWTPGVGNVCNNDGNQPLYMTKNPHHWMHQTLAECCKVRFGWDLTCIADSGGTSSGSAALSTGSKRWYKRATGAWICVQDCVGSSPCGGIASVWEPTIWNTRKECCNTMTWDLDCMTRDI